MNKNVIVVPNGIRYISDWKEYNLDNYNFPHILNKVITGCGYTEYCLRNNQNLILCSPRKMLLENKYKQHQDLDNFNVMYARSNFELIVDYEKDISVINKSGGPSPYIKSPAQIQREEEKAKALEEAKKEAIRKLKENVVSHWSMCQSFHLPCKILVTYDSFRHVKDILAELGVLDQFQTVIDEFQSVLIDSRFKASTELEFLYHLQSLQKVCFVSATPLLDKYLSMLDEFKNLPYYSLDWETAEPGRVRRPTIDVKFITRGLNEELGKTIKKYRDGEFDRTLYRDEQGNPCEIYSNEAVFFLNSVKAICSAIKAFKLTPMDTNILCARTEENEKRVKKAFNESLKELYPDDKSKRMRHLGEAIGTIPGLGEPHKMFTFCTRTVYLGADFYSTCASTYVYSDSNIECLSVDVSMDLEQILGRQRLDSNPWKNTAHLIVKTTGIKLTQETFEKRISDKTKDTYDLLNAYENQTDSNIKNTLAKNYELLIKAYNYLGNYVGVNSHGGKDKFPVFNNIVKVAERRAFDIQQVDYKDRFTVFNTLTDHGINAAIEEVQSRVNTFNSIGNFVDKAKYINDTADSLGKDSILFNDFLSQIPHKFKDYFVVFGPERIRALKYKESELNKEWERQKNNISVANDLKNVVLSCFSVGSRYTKSYIKEKLREIYEKVGYKATPKANDLSEWFDIKETQLVNKETGNRDNGYKILSKK